MGKGFPGAMDLGNGGGGGSSAATGSGSGAEAGVTDLLEGGVTILFLASRSSLAAPRGGSFLFLSIGTTQRTGWGEMVEQFVINSLEIWGY